MFLFVAVHVDASHLVLFVYRILTSAALVVPRVIQGGFQHVFKRFKQLGNRSCFILPTFQLLSDLNSKLSN